MLRKINENTLSSMIFITNVYHIYKKSDELYMYSFIILLITSILYHETYKYKYKQIDRIALINVILQGGYRSLLTHEYNKKTLITVILFMLTIYTYYIKIDRLNIIRNHTYIHILGSVGHHLITMDLK